MVKPGNTGYFMISEQSPSVGPPVASETFAIATLQLLSNAEGTFCSHFCPERYRDPSAASSAVI